MEQFKHIFSLPFVKDIQEQGGEVFIVGGCVRDYYLKKHPKDIDLVVRKISYDNLSSILSKHGKVDLVGESFGVLLFRSEEFEGEIAIVRTDKKDQNLKGHKSIVAQSDPELPLMMDLARRDFTINAMAIDKDLNLIDPYNGLFDLRKKIIKQVMPDTFVDDPLRMLRALQFAARFNFTLDNATFNNIASNAKLIKEITPERILMEFQKVISRNGNLDLFVRYLLNTKICPELINNVPEYFRIRKYISFSKIKTLGELLFILCKDMENIPDFCKDQFKIDNNTYKELKALDKVFAEGNELTKKWNMFEAFRIYPSISRSSLLKFNDTYPYFVTKYPKSLSDLNITGDFLMKEFFLKGPEIGVAYDNMLNAIFTDMVWYKDKESLLKFIK